MSCSEVVLRVRYVVLFVLLYRIPSLLEDITVSFQLTTTVETHALSDSSMHMANSWRIGLRPRRYRHSGVMLELNLGRVVDSR